jgi:hypothetical protein
MRYPVMAAAFFAASACALGQHVIVTAEGMHGAAPPDVSKDTVSVEVNRHPAAVESWVPLRGDQANLELYIVIDDGEDTNLGLQYESLKAFIEEQPATTKVGLAYLRNGEANIVAPVTADRESVAKAMRLPLGEAGIASSPYMGISDLIRKWPAADARREVLLISSGDDPWSVADPQNPYLLKAVADAQRAGILVHSIFYSQAGHAGHSYWLINWGQDYLSELGELTGGEAYWQGDHNPVSFDPFLKDLALQLKNQYLLTVMPNGDAPKAKPGLEPLRVSAHGSGASVHAPSQILMRPRN